MIRPDTAGYADADVPASGFKYVRKVKGRKWQARPWANGGRVNLGLYPNPLAAWKAVCAWARAGGPTAGRRPAPPRVRRRTQVGGGAVWRRAAAALLAHPDQPAPRLAAEAGVSREAVQRVRRALVADGALAVAAVVRSDGKPNPPRGVGRRHLTESQRGMIAAGVANMGEGRPAETSGIPLVSQSQAAADLTVSVDTVKAARPDPHAERLAGVAAAVRGIAARHPTWGVKRLAKAVGVGAWTVRTARRRFALPVAVPTPPKPDRSKRDAAAALTTAHPDWDRRRVAAEAGVCLATVANARRELRAATSSPASAG